MKAKPTHTEYMAILDAAIARAKQAEAPKTRKARTETWADFRLRLDLDRKGRAR